jgi:hypothetical protein
MDKRQFLSRAGILGAASMFPSVVGAMNENTEVPSTSVFNVHDFGAKGDGKTSDSVAIQNALDKAGAVSGTVYFPAGTYPCHDLKVPPHITLLAEPQWAYRGDGGAILLLNSDEASCLLDITGAFGVHLRGLYLKGKRDAQKEIHGIFLNNAEEYSKQEDSVIIDDCKVSQFSGHGVRLLRIWLFIIRHSYMSGNRGCGVLITGWDGFVTDNQLSGNGSHGFGCEESGATVMFTANRVEWNGGYGLYLSGGDAWNVTGNCFDRNGGAGLCALNMSATTVTGNVFRRCGKDNNKLAEGTKSCQVRLENCSGLSFVGNTALAGRDDNGKGVITPETGFLLRKLSYSVISANTFWKGYKSKLAADLGEHGNDYVFVNNVGSPIT